MEQFTNWEKFWQEWHRKEVESEADLYYQVAKTINKEPIRKEIFDLINKNICEILTLNKNENLVEFCCGNGLCTFEFSKVAGQVVAVDYSQHLIETARKHKSAPNIIYRLANICDFLDSFKSEFGFQPRRYLMNDALAYFETADLERILKSIISISSPDFRFLIRGVPNDELKWNFYNTEERKQKYLDGVANGDFTNAGMGRWWKPGEIEAVCSALQLKCTISNQVPPISDYRMDILISGN
jgi:SAM-dependent methyltransferase